MKKKESGKIYKLYVGFLVLFVVIALLLPQFVFKVQDSYWMTRTQVDARSNVDISQLHSFYEEQMYDRMSNFASMNVNSLTVTAIEHDIEEEEFWEILERIFYQDWMTLVLINTLSAYEPYGTFWKDSLEIQNCRKYIVYGDDFEAGVALMMWYFDIYIIDEDIRIRLLADTETDSMYYIKITTNDKQNDVTDYDAKKGNVAYDMDTSSEAYGKEKIEQLSMWAEQFHYLSDYYVDYYESERDDTKGDLYENPGDVKELYGNVEITEDRCMVEFPLRYEHVSLNFLFQVIYRNEVDLDFCMGIPAIGELIPEMIQD